MRLAVANAPRWLAIAASQPASRNRPRVFYGHKRVPARTEPAYGGMIKMQSLAERLPNTTRDFNLVYLVSSAIPRDLAMLLRLARRRGAPLVWNQNGVAYPGWAGHRTAEINRLRARGLYAADHVLYQSAFCKLSADRFLGEPQARSEVLHNPVDTERFVPQTGSQRGITVLVGGNQRRPYRLESALRAFALVVDELPDARLLVAGSLAWPDRPDPAEGERFAFDLRARLELDERVEFVGTYTQAEAPALLGRASLLLHTQYNDACPTIVLEALASGLPVVYSASGGVPELVGPDAGIGVRAPLDWEQVHPPEPEPLAEGILKVVEGLADYGEAARRRAVERFDLRPWLARHRTLFEELLR